MFTYRELSKFPVRLVWLAAALGSVHCGGSPSPVSPTHGTSAVLVGAGDIAQCGSPGTVATARLLDGIAGIVFTAGDNAYPHASVENFRDCYAPTWGRHKERTRPAPGNHEYETPGATPYFNYFGVLAGPPTRGYYRYPAGAWQVYSLNSNVDASRLSDQFNWLQDELANNPSMCTLVYFHHPLFSSGPNGPNTDMRDIWRLLYEFNVEVIVSGHDHFYERSARQDPDGRPDSIRGIRQFVVGTGGALLDGPVRRHANSEIILRTFGVLRLTLQTQSYTWDFLGAENAAVLDAGSGICR